MEDENIIWSDMSEGSSPVNPMQGMNMMPRPIEPCQMKAYDSLHEELLEKCNPKKFMSPYNKEKVDIANRLYKLLLDTNGFSDKILIDIRNQAMQQLGIQISTKELYQKLLKYCNPENFMDPYDFEAVQKANEYYALVEEYRNDVGELERLNKVVMRDDALRSFYRKEEEEKKERIDAEKRYDAIINTILIGALFVFIIIIISLLSTKNGQG